MINNILENIDVAIRCRPKIKSDKDDKLIKFIFGNNSLEVFSGDIINSKQASYSYSFNHIFDYDAKNYTIYQKTVEPIIQGVLEGINNTIFVYGQTGSGKTYTMTGKKSKEVITEIRKIRGKSPISTKNPKNVTKNLSKLTKTKNNILSEDNNSNIYNVETEELGILQHAMIDIFKTITKDYENEYVLTCNYYEIYNDNIYDLLDTNIINFQINSQIIPLQIKENTNTKEFFISKLSDHIVRDFDELKEILDKGAIARHSAQTYYNFNSSRSHVIFKLTVEKRDRLSNKKTIGYINFVDLAGSEKFENIENKRKTESKNINKSLFFLTRIIALLSTEQNKPNVHIPYRNSPLTKILKNSIGGDSRCLIILCASPCYSEFENNINTFKFGMLAKQIKNRIKINEIADESGIKYKKVKSYNNIYGYIKDNNSSKYKDDMKMGVLSSTGLFEYSKNKLKKQSNNNCNCLSKSNNKFNNSKYEKYYVKYKKLKENFVEINQRNDKNILELNDVIRDKEAEIEELNKLKNLYMNADPTGISSGNLLDSLEINCLVLLENIKTQKARVLCKELNIDNDIIEERLPFKKITKGDELNINTNSINYKQLIGEIIEEEEEYEEGLKNTTKSDYLDDGDFNFK